MFSNRVIKNSKLVGWESGKWKEGDIEIETVRKREREWTRYIERRLLIKLKDCHIVQETI